MLKPEKEGQSTLQNRNKMKQRKIHNQETNTFNNIKMKKKKKERELYIKDQLYIPYKKNQLLRKITPNFSVRQICGSEK